MSGLVDKKMDGASNTGSQIDDIYNSLIDFLITGYNILAGVVTFTNHPVTPSSAPTTNYQVANKKYVDDNKITVTPASGPASVSLTALPAGNQGPTTAGQEYFYLTIGTNSSGNIVMASGTAGVATPIPLPADCTQANCCWIVSPKYCYLNGVAMFGFSVAIDANRYVTIQTKGTNWVN